MTHFSKKKLVQILSQVLKKVNAPYDLIIVNEETMNEALRMKLTKKSVYIFLSTTLVLIFLILTSLILFTPLRYYIPGNSNTVSRAKLIKLQQLSDSLIKINAIREKYIFNLLQITNGSIHSPIDSTQLTQKEIEIATQNNVSKIDKASRYDYLKSQKVDSIKLGLHSTKDTSE